MSSSSSSGDDTATAAIPATVIDVHSSSTQSFPDPSPSPSQSKTQSAIQSLSSILPSPLPPALSSPSSLLHDTNTAKHISSLLRHPNSGSGNNSLCRWLYDTFQSGNPDLQLLVLRFLPTIAGVYLSRVAHRIPLAGFEAVLLALYAHETTSRNGQAITISIPDLSHPSVYHESKAPTKSNATELSLAVISPSLEPHGTVRSTRRARIVGVALELYYSKISQMPIGSKIDFCEFCKIWAGLDGEMYKDAETDQIEASRVGDENDEEKVDEIEKRKERYKKERIPLPWELLQPVLRILGHCIMGPRKDKELIEAAGEACRSLYARSMHDINSKAILASRSLLRLLKMEMEKKDEFDPTEISMSNVISI